MRTSRRSALARIWLLTALLEALVFYGLFRGLSGRGPLGHVFDRAYRVSARPASPSEAVVPTSDSLRYTVTSGRTRPQHPEATGAGQLILVFMSLFLARAIWQTVAIARRPQRASSDEHRL